MKQFFICEIYKHRKTWIECTLSALQTFLSNIIFTALLTLQYWINYHLSTKFSTDNMQLQIIISKGKLCKLMQTYFIATIEGYYNNYTLLNLIMKFLWHFWMCLEGSNCTSFSSSVYYKKQLQLDLRLNKWCCRICSVYSFTSSIECTSILHIQYLLWSSIFYVHMS